MRKYFFALFLILVAGVLLAQEEVTVSTIHVWVKVQDKSGQPVRGLKREDFTIFEDNRKVDATCFEEGSLAAQPTGQPTTQTAPGGQEVTPKKIIVFLDLYNTSVPEYKFIKPKLQDFLRAFQGKNVEIMLAGILPSRTTGIFAKPTTDIARLNELLDKAQPNALRDTTIENNEKEIRKVLYTGERSQRRTPADMISDAYKLAQDYSRQDTEITKFSLRALESFSDFLAKVVPNERIIVVFVSGGFSHDPGRRYYDIVDVASEELREQIEDPQLAIYRKSQDFEFTRELHKCIGRMNRLNVTLYTINTRGLIVSDPEGVKMNVPRIAKDQQALVEYGETLQQIAEETGGLSFSNSQNFKLGFNQVVQDVSQQYLVCYQAPAHAKKGEYHQIKVQAKDSSWKIRYRRGYFE